jgi:hypothetical protein
VSLGTILPSAVVDVTTTLIVTGAIASRDFYLGHHDRDAAVAAGSRDVFMYVMTTLGLVERYVTSWTGYDVEVRSISVRLGTSNYPGDQMRFDGTVTEVAHGDSGSEVTVDVVGRNARGAHVTATVSLLVGHQRVAN